MVMIYVIEHAKTHHRLMVYTDHAVNRNQTRRALPDPAFLQLTYEVVTRMERNDKQFPTVCYAEGTRT
jgi:hypothetical protein